MPFLGSTILFFGMVHPLAGSEAQLLVAETDKVIASDGQESDWFCSARLNERADTMVVGAQRDDDAGSNAGAAYIYELGIGEPNTWEERIQLRPPDLAAQDYFGWGVSISGDTVAVGNFPGMIFGGSGAVYLFDRNEGGENNWGLVRKLTAGPADGFGMFMSLDGDRVVVGATFDDEGAVNAGAVYLYERNRLGANNWGLVRKITAPDAARDDEFGKDQHLQGDTLVVGSHGDDDMGYDSGSVYIFDRNQGGADNWGMIRKINAGETGQLEMFGFQVELDGDILVVGQEFDGTAGVNAGAAFIFERNRGGPNNWGLVKKLIPDEVEEGDLFGRTSAVSGDIVAVAAYGYELGGEADRKPGAVYLFRRHHGGEDNWGQFLRIVPSDPPSLFGCWMMSFHRGLLAVPELGADDAGAVHLFRFMDPPALSIAHLDPGVQIDWPDVPGHSFALQETALLEVPDWGFAPSGLTKPAVLSPSDPTKFFRLQKVTPLRITNQLPEFIEIPEGDDVTLRVGAEGEGTLTYQWRFEGIDLLGANQAELELFNCQCDQAGAYEVVVSDAFDSKTSHTELRILVRPYIVQHPQSQTVAAGDTVTFSVTVTNTATLPITYKWRKGVPVLVTYVLEERTSTFSITNVQPSDAGSYRVSVQNRVYAEPGFMSDGATLTVE